MANNLTLNKQAVVIGALAEGSSIRSIERMTNIHRDTIMRLGVRVGEACEKLLDEKMVNLDCHRIQVDEIWGYINKKQKNIKATDDPRLVGDIWTFVAIDSDTKIVPAYAVGKRDSYTANTFMVDLAKRLKNRVQVSSDALSAYPEAVERGFGSNVDYGQIVKSYTLTDLSPGRYSPPDIVKVERTPIRGRPAFHDISTSHVERQNLTMRMHCRRLTRLTNGFSKKLDNFRAAMGLHFAYYNLVKVHKSLRTTPAMAAGVVPNLWTVTDLVNLAN